MAREILKPEEFEECLKIAEGHLESAEILFKAGLYRDSISRSYYAFFDIMTFLLALKGFLPKTHGGALQLFGLYFIKTGIFSKEYGPRIKQLMERRQEADYEWKAEFTGEEAKEALEEAKEFIQVVKEKKEEIFKNQKSQKGFGVIGIIFVVLAVALIGLGGGYVYLNQKEKKLIPQEKEITQLEKTLQPEEKKQLEEKKSEITPSPESVTPTILDSDNDGLSNEEEKELGTDPNNPDTDGDGYLDGEEVTHGYNPKDLGKFEPSFGNAIADWKVYRNEEYGYEVKFPNNWTIEDLEPIIDEVNNIPSRISIQGDSKEFHIEVSPDIKRAEFYKITPGRQGEIQIAGKILAKIVSFNGGNIEESGYVSPSVWIYFIKNNLAYFIELTPTNEISGVFDQILSTFRFLD